MRMSPFLRRSHLSGMRLFAKAGQPRSGRSHLFGPRSRAPCWSQKRTVPTTGADLTKNTVAVFYDGGDSSEERGVPAVLWHLGKPEGTCRWPGPLSVGICVRRWRRMGACQNQSFPARVGAGHFPIMKSKLSSAIFPEPEPEKPPVTKANVPSRPSSHWTLPLPLLQLSKAKLPIQAIPLLVASFKFPSPLRCTVAVPVKVSVLFFTAPWIGRDIA